MDGLSIVTGIGILCFLLLYIAFNLEKEHKFLRFLMIFAVIFTLAYIPQLSVDYLNRDCGINSTGGYYCYWSNGTLISSYPTTNFGDGFFTNYMWFVRIFGAYVFIYLAYYVFKFMAEKLSKYRWRKHRLR